MRVAAATLMLALVAPVAWAQPTPAKPVRLVVPFAAGTQADTVARMLAERLPPSIAPAYVVDNRPGAGGTIGAAQVAQAAPDGHTLLVHTSAHTLNPHVYASLGYDTLRDFAGVTPLATLPHVLVVAPGRFTSVAELVAEAKGATVPLRYTSWGAGSPSQLSAERFRVAAHMPLTHIATRSPADALADVLAGRAEFTFAPLVTAMPAIRERRAIPLAVGTPRRAASLPDVPTTLEAGVPGSDYTFWIGLFAPAKTPRDTVNLLHGEVAKAMSAPDMRERLAQFGAEAWTLSPAQFDDYVRFEIAANAAIVGAAGIRPN